MQNNQENECHICSSSFRTNRWLIQYLNTCRWRNCTNLNVSGSNESDGNNDNEIQEPDLRPGEVYQKDLEEAYNKIVCWSKDIFMVRIGAAGKKI